MTLESNRETPPKDRPWFKVWPDHLPKNLKYPDVPAWWIMQRNIERFAEKTAVILVNHENLGEIERMTYGELWQSANSLAAGLRKLGIRKGDRVATLLSNSASIIISYYGVWMAGAAITPCNVLAKEKEVESQLKDAGASMIIAAEHLSGLARSVSERMGLKLVLVSAGDPAGKIPGAIGFENLIRNAGERPADFSLNPAEDMAVLLYTGGTTGNPKGTILTHRNIVANTMQFAQWYSFRQGDETCICAIPMSHSGGMSGVMNVPIYAAATMIVFKKFVAEKVAQAINKYSATRFFGVPTMYVAILNNKDARACNMSSLKACRTNAAPLPVAVKQDFDQMIGKEVLIEGYGLTETSPLTHANPVKKAKAGSIGIPLPDTDAKIIDLETGEDLPVNCEGELVIRGPQVMKGYLDRPEATDRAMAGGWFHTGDVAKMDEEGYFFIVDRLKDMINSGGYKVWPREVEEVLYAHPKVRLAMVIGVPDDYYGETVKAYIVPKDDAVGSITQEEIISFCKERIARYKAPRIVEFRDSLPISPQGKVLRRVMKEEAKAELRSGKGNCDVSA